MSDLFGRDPEAYLIEAFRQFHMHPELSGEEVETTRRIREILEQAGIEILDLPLRTGLVAVLGHRGGKVLALRADIDALPIEEETELVYRSVSPLRMHACGHDFHLTSLLGAALFLKANEAKLRGLVKFIFQPAEEINRGAKEVLETKVLDDVDRIYGIHAAPDMATNQLGIKTGAVTAAVDRFAVLLNGRGSHAAMPHEGLDPVLAASGLVMNAQSLVSRRSNPFHAVVLSFTHLAAGNVWNVIPDTAFLEGTVRTLNPRDREEILENLGEMVHLTARAHGLTADFTWEEGPPAVINAEAPTRMAVDVASEMGFELVVPPDSMIGEDFAFYLERIEGCFILVGTGHSYALHNPKMEVDPAAIWPTSKLLAKLAMSYLT